MALAQFFARSDNDCWSAADASSSLGFGDDTGTALLEPGQLELESSPSWSENPLCMGDDDLDDDEAYFLDDEDDDDDDFGDDYDDDEFEEDEFEDDSDDEIDDDDL